MAEKYSEQNSHKRNIETFKYILIAAFLILLIVGIGIGVFFKVTEIVVVGATEYSAQEIREISGIEEGDSLYLIKTSEAARKICEELPLIKEAKIIRTIPNKVSIVVTENTAVAYMKVDNVYWTIDSSGKILKKLSMPPANLIIINGVTPISPKVGEKMSLGDAGSTAFAYLVALLSAMESEGVVDKVSEIDMTDVSNVKFKYMDRFTVNFGRGDNCKEKLKLIIKSAEELGETEIGDINIISDNEARFVPSQTE